MTALDHLRALARGERPADDGLLGNTRCAWGGGELVGEEAILAAFCAKPFAADNDLLAIETGQSAALIARGDALVADIYDQRIGRLWRVGSGVAMPPEQRVDVAFDADMRHERGDVFFHAEAHPELDEDGARSIVTAVRDHVEQVRRDGHLRVRAFVLRAFRAEDTIAALTAVYRLSNEPSRSASFGLAILGIGVVGEPLVVSDPSPRRDWTPRL